MFDRIETIEQFNQYTAYLNQYLGTAPAPVRAQLIEQECDYLEQQFNQTIGYNEHVLHTQLFLLHLKREQHKSKCKASDPALIEESHSLLSIKNTEAQQAIEQVKFEDYLSLSSKVQAQYSPTYTPPSDLNDIETEYSHLLSRLFWGTLLKELQTHLRRAARKNVFTEIDKGLLKYNSKSKFTNDFLAKEAILYWETQILIQKHATLSDTYHEERSAVGAILKDSYKHTLELHLAHSKDLVLTLNAQTNTQETEITVDEKDVKQCDAAYSVTLKPDHIHKTDNVITLTFEPNAHNNIYRKTIFTLPAGAVEEYEQGGMQLVTVTLDSGQVCEVDRVRDSDPIRYNITLQTDLAIRANKEIIYDAFDDFLSLKRVVAEDVKTHTDEFGQLTYLGVSCNVKDGFLIRSYEHTNDTEFEKLAIDEKQRLKHKDTPRYIHENIDDRDHHLSDYYKGTAHKFLDLAQYYDPSSPDLTHPTQFLYEQLHELHQFKTLYQGIVHTEKHNLSITDTIQLKPIASPFDTALNDTLLTFETTLMSLVKEKHTTSVEKNILARQAAVTSLDCYLKRREADLHALHQEILHLMQSLESVATTEDEKDMLQSLCDSSALDEDIAKYQQLIHKKINKKIAEKPSLQAQQEILQRISHVIFKKQKHLSATVKTALSIVDDIEAHDPTAHERTLLDNLRHFFLFPLRTIFKKAGWFTDNDFFFSTTERSVMKVKKGIYATAHTVQKTYNKFAFFQPKYDTARTPGTSEEKRALISSGDKDKTKDKSPAQVTAISDVGPPKKPARPNSPFLDTREECRSLSEVMSC